MALLPQLPGTFPGTLLMGLLVVVFGFFFVTVSSRIVGIIGSSSNPISGMTIATLMATSLIFVAIGWTGEVYQALALSVGGIVCIAAANAGATSQDLKTGYIVGGTPLYQQLGLVVGVLASAAVIGWTLQTLDASMRFEGVAHAIGTDRYAAPQATLMATIIKGLLAQDLPWGLVFVGMAIAVVIELCGVRSLSFAVGAYLPLSTTAPIFIGGALKWFVDRQMGVKAEQEVRISKWNSLKRLRSKNWVDNRLLSLKESNPFLQIKYERFLEDQDGSTANVLKFFGCDSQKLYSHSEA